MLARAYSVKIGVIFQCSVWKTKKLIKKQTYMKTETYKLYPRDFWIFLPNIIKINLYNSELYRFKVGAFFETQCSSYNKQIHGQMAAETCSPLKQLDYTHVIPLYVYIYLVQQVLCDFASDSHSVPAVIRVLHYISSNF